MIVLGTILPFALALSGLHHLPATRVGMVGMLEPVLAGDGGVGLAERGAQPGPARRRGRRPDRDPAGADLALTPFPRVDGLHRPHDARSDGAGGR